MFRGADGLQNLRQDWHNLVADQKVGGFYHLFEWYELNLAANQNEQDFLTIGVYSGDHFLALLPLRATKRRLFGLRIRVLEFPNTEAILHDAILAPGSNPNEIVEAIRSELSFRSGVGWDFMRLNEIPGSSLFAKRNPESPIPLGVIQHTGYSNIFAKLSPGNLLTEYVINHYLAETNIRFINLISNSKWRDSWHPSKTEVVTCYVFNRSILGLLSYVLIPIKSALNSTPQA